MNCQLWLLKLAEQSTVAIFYAKIPPQSGGNLAALILCTSRQPR